MELIILILENLDIVLMTLFILMLVSLQWILHWTQCAMVWILNKTQ